MKVNSTGLGKTTMVAHFEELSKVNDNGCVAMRLNIEATEPVHWTIKATVGGDDVRRFLKMALRPSIIWFGLKLILFGKPLGPPEKK